MMQYKLIRPFLAYEHQGPNSLLIDDHRGSGFGIHEKKIELLRYDDTVRLGTVGFQGFLYQLITNRDLYKDLYESIVEGETFLKSEDGLILDIDPIIVLALVFNRAPVSEQFRLIPSGLVKSKDENSFLVVDIKKQSYEAVLCHERLRPFIVDDELFGIQRSSRKIIVKYNSLLKVEWDFEFEGDIPKQVFPRIHRIHYKNLLIFNLSMRRQKREYLDGVVCALAKADGSVMWKQKFHYQVEDLDLLNDHQLIASTGNQLVVMDAASGEVVREIDVEMELQTYSRFLFVSDNYVFLFCQKNKVMQIYDKAGLELLRHFDARELKWVFVERPKVIDNKLFLVVGLTPIYGGLVVLDLSDIHAPLQYEAEPDISISTPDSDNGAIVIQADTPDLGAVLRFTEMYGLQHAENEGDEGRGLDKNPNFNGKVLLKYGGYSANREDVIEKLDILKRRFDYYASDMKLYCGRGKTPVTFDYELM